MDNLLILADQITARNRTIPVKFVKHVVVLPIGSRAPGSKSSKLVGVGWAQVFRLQQSTAALVSRLNIAEQDRRNMYSHLSMLREKCADAAAENDALRQEVTAAHAAVAVSCPLLIHRMAAQYSYIYQRYCGELKYTCIL